MLARRVLRWAVASLLAAAAESAGGRQVPVRVFTVADGLPQIEISCLFEDHRGYLWVGTTDGLARFDGRDFVTYGVSEGLPHPVIHDIVEDSDGALWIATGQGIARFEVTNRSDGRLPFRTFLLSPQDTFNNILRLHRDSLGRIWAGSSTGLFVLDVGAAAFREVPLRLRKPPVVLDNVASLAESRAGDLWVGTAWGLVRFLPDGRQLRYAPAAGHATGVWDVHADAGGRIWICWERGVTIFRPPPGETATTEALLPQTRARCFDLPDLSPADGQACDISVADGLPDIWCFIHEGRRGEIRILSEQGVWLVTPNGLQPDETIARFAASKPNCILEDRHGSLWVGTSTAGVVRIAQTGASSYTTEDGLVVNRISSVFEGTDGELYVTTTGGAVHRRDGDHFAAVMPRLPARIRYRGWGWGQIVLRDRLGDWWYATGHGLARYARVSRLEDLARTLPRRIYTRRDGLPADEIFRVFEDSRGDVWVAVIDVSVPGAERLTRWDRRSDRFVSCPPAFHDTTASAFAEDAAGNVWVGFYLGGLARYRGGGVDLYPPGESVPRGFVRQILRDSSGRLWAATTQEGLVRVDHPEAERPAFRTYRRAQGLSSDRVYSIAEDRSGYLYVGTSRGIDRLDPRRDWIRPYTAAEDPASTITVAATRDRAGRLWFGTQESLLRFEPQPDETAPPPIVYIRGVEVRGERVSLPPAGVTSLTLPDLPHDRDQIRIEFAAPDLAPAGRIHFRYALEGSGRAWSEPSLDDSVQYAGLSPGRYRFLVEAVTSDGVQGPAPASLEFRLMSPVWRRWWFLAIGAVCAAALLLALHRLRVARLLEVERVRSRIAADLHDDLGTSLYRISILSELANRRIGDAGEEAKRLVSEIGDTARGLIESAGDMVWSVDPRRDDLASLAARIRHYASEMLEGRGIVWSLDGSNGAERIVMSAETRRQLYLIFKEAIRNAVRHGRPSSVAMRLAALGGYFEGEVRDDGVGFDADRQRQDAESSGYGLHTMRERAASLRGELDLRSAPGAGTQVRVRVPGSREA